MQRPRVHLYPGVADSGTQRASSLAALLPPSLPPLQPFLFVMTTRDVRSGEEFLLEYG